MEIAGKTALKRFWSKIKAKLDEIKVRSKTITINKDSWIQNGNKYEYAVTDNTVTAFHLINAHMDLENQAKMVDAEINSFSGGFKIATSELPTEDIVMNITIQKAN